MNHKLPLSLSILLMTALASLNGQTYIGTDGVWATPANWSSGVAPVSNPASSAPIIFNSDPAVKTITVSTDFVLNSNNGVQINSGAGALIFAGTRVFTASGANLTINSAVTADQTFNAPLALQFARTSQANHNFTNNSTTATLTFRGGFSNPSTAASGVVGLFFRGAGNTVIASDSLAISGNTRLTKTNSGAGSLTINNANSFTKGVDLAANSGSLILGNAQALGGLGGAALGGIRVDGGASIRSSIDLTGSNKIMNAVQFNGTLGTASSGRTIPTPAALGATSFVVNDATGIAVGQVISGNGAGLNALVTAVSGTTITIDQPLASASSGNYTFTPYTNAGTATFVVGGSNNIEFGGNVQLTTLNSNRTAATQTLQINNSTTIISGVVSDASASLGGVGSLSKTGTGALVLTGANTYTGATTVNAGTLLINSQTGSATGSSGLIEVNSGGALGGNGFTSSLIRIEAGASFAIGGSTGAGTALLTSTSTGFSALVLEAGSTTTFEINGTGKGVDYDAFKTDGRVSFGGDFTGSIGNTVPGGTTVYDLFDFIGIGNATNLNSFGITGAYSANLSLSGTGGTGVWSGTALDGTLFSFSQATGDLTISAIPEPSAFAVIAGLATLGLAAARRRRATV